MNKDTEHYSHLGTKELIKEFEGFICDISHIIVSKDEAMLREVLDRLSRGSEK